MKFVLLGCSEGIQPTTQMELDNGIGPLVTNSLQPEVVQDDYRIARQSFDFFSKYIYAITGGELTIDIEIIELPDLCLPVSVTTSEPYFATGDVAPVWDALSEEVKNSTDWWWIMYPSHVPEAPVFDDIAFITGGMGSDSKGGPVFIIDDKWIVRKPLHLGEGNYSDIERRLYLPQWFQHEFFHHLYRIYPEFELEVNGHDWFNPNFWADDFEGLFEADYYAESLHKRLQTDCVSLSRKLITRVADEVPEEINNLTMDHFIGGDFSLDIVTNNFHTGQFMQESGNYFWRNEANVQWEVIPNFSEGRLETGADSPYPGEDFSIKIFQTLEGQYLPGVTEVLFLGESYRKRFALLRDVVPIEVVMGSYKKVPLDSAIDEGSVVKNGNEFFWEDNAGNSWGLTANLQEEIMELDNDSPTPEESFDLVVIQDECATNVLGFEYLEHYYWKPKRDVLNESSILQNPIDNLELEDGAGTLTLNVSQVFSDPENDDLFFFVTSADSSIVAAEIVNQELLLTGISEGNAQIYLMALDENGGLTVNSFNVLSNDSLSIEDEEGFNFISTNIVEDVLFFDAPDSNYQVSVFSLDGRLQKEILAKFGENQLIMNDLSSGLYFLQFVDVQNGNIQVEKIIKL